MSGNASVTVAATVGRNTITGVYIYGYPTLTITAPSLSAAGEPGQEITITAGVLDARTSNGNVAGIPVEFDLDNKSGGAGLLNYGDTAAAYKVDSSNMKLVNPPSGGTTLHVQTNGATTPNASVQYEIGTAGGVQVVTVSAAGQTKKVKIRNALTSARQLYVQSVRGSNSGEFDIIATIEDNEEKTKDVEVKFTTVQGGTLTNTPTGGSSTTAPEVTDTTNLVGKATAIYDPQGTSGALQIIVTAPETGTDIDAQDVKLIRKTINVRGGSTNQPTTQTPYLSISPSSLTGSPGESRSFTVYAYNASGNRDSGVSVALSSSGVTVPSSVRTGESVSVTLPSSSTSISATASGYTSRSLSVSVQAVPDEIVKVSGDNQSGTVGASLSSSFVVRVEDSSNNPISGQTVTFQVTSGGGSLSSTSVTTDSSGEASATLTLGSSTGTNTVTASVSGISSVTFTATTEEEELPPDALVIDGSANVIGELNTALDLSVQIVDEDDEGVTGELVLFRITEGSGRLSPSRARTDSDGYAAITLTPRASGTIEVEASSGDLSPVTFTITTGNPPDALVYISGNNQSGKSGTKLANPFVVEVIDEDDEPVSGATVTFAVTAGGGTLSTTSATTGSNGRAQTRLTLGEAIGDNTVVARVSGLTDRVTFKARTGAQVLIDAAQRPPMYWVDSTNGTLHRLIEDEVEDLATNAKGATNIAVDSTNGYIYWTAQTAANKGVIRRAGLNGKGVQTLKTVSTLPMGIAIDAAGGTVYWTNARGNILSMPVSGGKVTNILRNLSSPGPIAISNGVLYWGEAAGSIRKMSLTAKSPKTPVNLATGIGEPLAIVIAKGKVYWIEVGGGGSGKLQRVNTNSKNIQQLKAFASGVPLGLTADSSDNKLYWTKRTGKIQRANFAGKYVKDIVSGLPKPGSLAIGVESIATMPAAQGNQQTNTQQANNQQTQQTSDTSKYDVNGDGAVDNLDVTIVALALGTDNLDYDVNGDGSVDANDLRAVIANSDSSGAAPAIEVDLKAMDIDFNRVQEQIEMLLAAGDISLEGQRVLLYLQHLLASARPDETVLLANYPNPFNPETWIPYHLAESTDVAVRIYDAQGTLVRVLTLGHQTAGYYTSRSRAAYWDGRNAIGERVASGVYFYQLQTDAISPMRKMVILK